MAGTAGRPPVAMMIFGALMRSSSTLTPPSPSCAAPARYVIPG